jgi:hypothetical protein
MEGRNCAWPPNYTQGYRPGSCAYMQRRTERNWIERLSRAYKRGSGYAGAVGVREHVLKAVEGSIVLSSRSFKGVQGCQTKALNRHDALALWHFDLYDLIASAAQGSSVALLVQEPEDKVSGNICASHGNCSRPAAWLHRSSS